MWWNQGAWVNGTYYLFNLSLLRVTNFSDKHCFPSRPSYILCAYIIQILHNYKENYTKHLIYMNENETTLKAGIYTKCVITKSNKYKKY